MAGSALMAVVLLSLVSLLPLPYVLLRPGPVRDVLGTTEGTAEGTPMIAVDGAPTYDTEGSLDMLTVTISGGPGSSASLWSVLEGWVLPSVAVRPVEEQYPPDLTEEEIDEENAVSMVSSQESATAAALAELDIAYETTLSVAGFADGSDAAARLRRGDVVTGLAGATVPDLPQLRDALQETSPGEPVTVRVERDGQPVDVDVRTGEGPDGTTVLGVLLEPSYEFPFDVRIEIEDIGGPSAGMMFSLGIVDVLTPGAMTGGRDIAGTGTIDAAGEVGPIGGIRQKLYGAERAGADWFLAPSDNCEEVVGHVPGSLRVVSVQTLADARAAVEAIGSDEGTDRLPTCRR
jgi:PDZ domain-containing protein